MKKRIISLLLAFAAVFGMVAVGVTPVSAASKLTTSDDCIELLKQEEGFSKKPYWDYAQYTIGYGSACPADMLDYYTENGITKKEATTLLRNNLSAIERQIHKKIIKKYDLELTQNQFDAIVLFSYNCGTGWTGETTGTFFNAIVKGATGNDLIRAFALWCSAGGQIKTFLLRRRLCEANIYLNGIYSKTAPENYNYVLYNANGGTTSPKSQGYDAELTAEPFPVPQYGDYTFDGWYTQKTGGEKVTVLDASTASTTLYAHWLDSEGNAVEEKKEEKIKVKVKVTGDEVNIRKGPGTNYAAVGTAQKGDKITITQTAYGNDYQWGKFTDGWICLQFTNYEEVMSKENEPETTPEETEPEETEPEETEPEETKPEETKPEETEPEETKPEETEPEETEPEETEPEATEPEEEKVMGTVKVNDWLRVRSGPSTGYAEVRRLNPNDRVEILEQKVVGAMVWGKIEDGWVSMEYIVLDESKTEDKQDASNKDTSSQTDKVTGTVNVNDWLRVRSGAGTSYSIAGYLKPGEKVTITKQKTVDGVKWGKISEGWVSMEYIKLDSKSENKTESSTETKKVTGTVNVNDWLRVRSGAGTSYSVAGYLKPGEKVTITKQKTVNGTKWGKIDNGWVSMDYIKVTATSSATETEKTETDEKTVTADCLCVRKAAGTGNTIVGYLYQGAKVTVSKTKKVSGKTWGKIDNGWVCMDYVK